MRVYVATCDEAHLGSDAAERLVCEVTAATATKLPESKQFRVELSLELLGKYGGDRFVCTHRTESGEVCTRRVLRHDCPQTLTIPCGPPEVRMFLCQKDEAYLLRAWIHYALRVATSPAHIRIYDDGSTDESVLSVLKQAREQGVDVVFRSESDGHRSFFQRKHHLFGSYVTEHVHDVHTLFLPLDADDFVVSCARIPRRSEPSVAISTSAGDKACGVTCKYDLDSDPAVVLKLLSAAVQDKAHGYLQYNRFRNFSFSDSVYYRPDEPPKVMIYGGGHACLTSYRDCHCIGYHSVKSHCKLLAVLSSIAGVEFHNMPHAVRVQKSLMMSRAPGVTHHRFAKYDRIARMTQKEYEDDQFDFGHARTCARSATCAKLLLV